MTAPAPRSRLCRPFSQLLAKRTLMFPAEGDEKGRGVLANMVGSTSAPLYLCLSQIAAAFEAVGESHPPGILREGPATAHTKEPGRT